MYGGPRNCGCARFAGMVNRPFITAEGWVAGGQSDEAERLRAKRARRLSGWEAAATPRRRGMAKGITGPEDIGHQVRRNALG